MKTTILSAALAASLIAGLATSQEARTWTSADDASKKFQGTFVEAKGDQVTIKHSNGKTMTFAKTKLSAEDQKYIDSQAAAKSKAAETQTSPMALALKGRTLALDGKKLKKNDFLATKNPEYYLLYWGASWCGPCQQAAPALVELYNDKLAKATNIELIHISSDDEEQGMLSFVTDHQMKFPVVSKKDRDKLDLIKPLFPQGIPNYKLVDAKGELIAEGQAAKDKAAEIAEGKSSVAAAGE
ncbi:MAG: thioredoxin-like domain-containing protein [Verrucomicrobiales bacterium]